MTPAEWSRFEAKFSPEPNTGCWLWHAFTSTGGYGIFFLRGDYIVAHRASYEHLRGSIGAGLSLDHLCRQRCCVNPDHLEPVTHRENVRRGLAGARQRAQTHCIHGHPFDDTNTRVTRAGKRKCLACDRRRVAPEDRLVVCKNGHPLVGDNLAEKVTRGILYRRCRACARERWDRRRAVKVTP